MTALPPATDFTDSTVTEGQFKTAMTNLRAYLSGLFGTDGTAATARAAVGAQEDVITTRGDIIRGDASGDAERLALGSAGRIPQSDGTDVLWVDPTFGRNAIINGDGRIQQRGDFTLVKDSFDFAGDRFEGMATGTAVSAGTLTTVTNATAGSTGHAHKFSGVTLTGAGVLFQRHRIESLDAVRFKNQTASLSVVVRHDVGASKTFTLFVRKANAKNNFSAVTEVSNDGGTSVADATTTTLKFENVSMGDVTNGIEIELKMEVGAITTKVVSITEWQLELGSVATPFERRLIGQELELSKRYFERVALNSVTGEMGFPGYANATTSMLFQVSYVEKRATPTVSSSAAGTFDVLHEATLTNVTGISFTDIGKKVCRGDAAVGAVLTVGNGGFIMRDGTDTAFIDVTAEL